MAWQGSRHVPGRRHGWRLAGAMRPQPRSCAARRDAPLPSPPAVSAMRRRSGGAGRGARAARSGRGARAAAFSGMVLPFKRAMGSSALLGQGRPQTSLRLLHFRSGPAGACGRPRPHAVRPVAHPPLSGGSMMRSGRCQEAWHDLCPQTARPDHARDSAGG